MSFLYEFVVSSFIPSAQQTINRILNKFRLQTDQQLPKKYYQTIIEDAHKHSIADIFKQLLNKMLTAKKDSTLIKLITIIFKILKKHNYSQQLLVQLQNLKQLKIQGGIQNWTYWVRDLWISCVSYLGRVPSFADVFDRSKIYKQKQFSPQIYQSDLLRMTNLYALLFPKLNTSTNTVGRYYKKSIFYYQQFYCVLREQLIDGYQYMKFICDRILKQHRRLETQIVETLITIIRQIQLLCDQMQQFITSKYFKSKQLNKKIYFKQEDIMELTFHLSHRSSPKYQTADTYDSPNQQAHCSKTVMATIL